VGVLISFFSVKNFVAPLYYPEINFYIEKNKYIFDVGYINTDDCPLRVYTGLDPVLRSSVEYMASVQL